MSGYNAGVRKPVPAIAIDASEWFVDESWREHVTPRHWRRLPARADTSVRKAFEQLQQRGVRATFFVPAALAYRAPELLQDLVLGGHEIALSVRSPWPIDQVPEGRRVAFVRAWEDERAELERVIGVGIHGFQSCWSVPSEAASNAWWHADLKRLGFDYDATPVAGSDTVAVALLGESAGALVAGQRFSAWQLDQDQPRLMGLPRDVREAHEHRVQRGSDQLAGICRLAEVPVVQSLGLPRREPAAIPLPPETVLDEPVSQDSVPTPDVPRLAIVVPLKDEADSVPTLFQELTAVTHALADVADCQFVLVDDGSTDQTWPLLERVARKYPRVRLVRHEINRGVAAAIRTGILATECKLVASIDGDLSYDPMELRAMLQLILDADVVTASPYHPNGSVHNVPGWRLFLSRTLSRAYQILLRKPVKTWTSCFRLYRRDAVAHLPLANPGFLGTAELLVRVLRRGGRVAEHPCTLEARLLGFSKMRVVSVIFDHLRLLLLVALRRVK